METLAPPTLLTFDVFGTVLDWRRGLRDALAGEGISLDDDAFDRVIDAQAAAESGSFRRYADITAESLESVLGASPEAAARIGADVGTWPPYADAAEGLRRLMRIAPCVAITNSDLHHGVQAQKGLGFRLDDWICAEESRCYKPDPEVWRFVSERRGAAFGPTWWHVSAYADYDLVTARDLGLTCVYVARPHARPGPKDVAVGDLLELAAFAESLIG